MTEKDTVRSGGGVDVRNTDTGFVVTVEGDEYYLDPIEFLGVDSGAAFQIGLGLKSAFDRGRDRALPPNDLTNPGTNYVHLRAIEHAAIQLRVPMSENPWIDDMIRAANRRDAAVAAMNGLLSWGPDAYDGKHMTAAAEADMHADALIAELEKGGGE